MVLRLYAIPITHPAFEPLKEALLQKWNSSLAHLQNNEVFISYAWGGESENIADELDQAFQYQGVSIIRDKRDLGYKDSLDEFMNRIGQGKAIIIIVSEKYLKSENCLFELLLIAKNGQFKDRVFPITLKDAGIYDVLGRIKYVHYWEQRLNELDEAIKEIESKPDWQISDADKAFIKDAKKYDDFRKSLPQLTDILKDMNALTPELHRETGFSEIINAVMTKLEE